MKRQYYIITILVLIVSVSAFYWYELRPSSIIKTCATYANNTTPKSLMKPKATPEEEYIKSQELAKFAPIVKQYSDEMDQGLTLNQIPEGLQPAVARYRELIGNNENVYQEKYLFYYKKCLNENGIK